MISKNKYLRKEFSFFNRSFKNAQIFKKHPFLSSLHRGIDGALVGVIMSGAVMTTFALHSQHLWTLNFSRLQLTRDLSNRIEESTAILERYFLTTASYPKSMVITKSSHLLYVDKPIDRKKTPVKDLLDSFRDQISSAFYPIANGY